MIDTSLVTDRFLMLASLENADETVQSLCQSGINKLESIINPDADDTDTRLVDAAAGDAFYQWVLINKAASKDDFKSFRAGDITIQNDVSKSVEAAKAIRDAAFDAIADLIEDRDFYFGEVLINDVEPSF